MMIENENKIMVEILDLSNEDFTPLFLVRDIVKKYNDLLNNDELISLSTNILLKMNKNKLIRIFIGKDYNGDEICIDDQEILNFLKRVQSWAYPIENNIKYIQIISTDTGEDFYNTHWGK